MTGPSPIIEAVDVGFRYGDSTVLQGLSLSVARGEIMALVGRNGAGKTTFLRVLSGALASGEGTVCLDGRNVLDMRPKERAARIALVPQNPVLPLGFTALEVVLMGRNPHLGLLQWEGPKDVAAAVRAMEMTETAGLQRRTLSSLSGGERQRVFIARALAQDASLLLLDEPTAHLDIGYQTGVLDTIEGIRRNTGVTVVAAMHDLTLAAQYCDRMAVLHHGAIFALGEPREVLTAAMVLEAFSAEVSVIPHPVHGTPVVLPVKNTGASRSTKP